MSYDNLVEERFSIIKGLEVCERCEENNKRYFIKNPITNKFFILGEIQYKVLVAFDKDKTINDVVESLGNSGINISYNQITAFKDKLINMKLLSCNDEEISVSKSKVETQKGKTFLQKLLLIKFSLLDPNNFIEKVLKRAEFIFSPIFLAMMATYVMFGIGIYIYKFSPFNRAIVADSASKNVVIVAILYIITILASFVHEMAHALTCKKFGGNVNEMGILIIYFRPGLFCNISDSYLFKERKHRVYVSIAGIILDFIVWSTIILIGYFLEINGFNMYFIPAFGFYGLITILFELNPLIKLDGYYALIELVNIYNLRENSFKYLKNMVIDSKLNTKIDKKERIVYLLYSILAGVYSTWLIFYTFYVIFKYLIIKLSIFGAIISVIILILLFYDLIKKVLGILAKIFVNMRGNIGG